MSEEFLDKSGLSYFWTKIKAWCNAAFATIVHTHTSYAVKHSYTIVADAATNWYRIANANTSQMDTTKYIHAQFILTAYNASYNAGHYERWFVNAEVFGCTAHITIFGSNSYPFSQARILYENTIANLDSNDRPALDIYLNQVYSNGTTNIEIEEVYNSGWTFLADGQLAASSVPSGFENVACGARGNGVERSTYADYATYLNRQISNFTAAFTLADSNTYRSRTLNCTGTFTITIPSLNSGYMWCVIKNKNTSSGVITLHPSTTSVLIDGSNADITLQPMEYVCIHSAGANNYSLIADGRWKSQKADKATTLAGYGITDAKIANGTIILGSNSITPLTSVPSHNQASNTINTMTGYSKPSSGSAIAASDSLNSAIGKLEAKVDAYDDSNYVHKTGNETVAGSKTFSSVISGSIDGNAGTADAFSASKEIALTGDVTGTASSTGGWSISTSRRSCIVGQSTASSSNPWYKVATFTCNEAYYDANIIFLVEDTYSNANYGILKLRIRTNGDTSIDLDATSITWLIATGMSLNSFVLVCPSGTSPVAELWTYIGVGWLFRRFTVLSEGYRSASAVIYTLLNASSAGQSPSITTAGTQKISVLAGNAAYDENGRNIASGYLWRGSYERIEGTSNAHKNLNDYTSTGFYNVKTANVDNCPTGIGIDAVLLVYPWTSSADSVYGTQEITESAASGDVRRWLRKFNNGAWSSWKQIAFQSSVDNCVTLSGNQSISDSKEFIGVLRLRSANYLQLVHPTADYQSTPPSGGCYLGISTTEKNLKTISRMQTWLSQDKSSGWAIQCKAYDNLNTTTYSGTYALYINQNASSRIAAVSNVTVLRPDQGNGTITLGTSSNRWGTLYTTTNVNVSSDERLKNSIQEIPDNILDAWHDINWLQFKYNISVEEKGDAARIHSGIIAQQAKEAFKAHGADAARYGFFCWDEWDDEPEVAAEDGSVIKEARSAGEAFSVRYGEALCMEAAYQRRENARLKKRVSDLEDRLAALELRLGSE